MPEAHGPAPGWPAVAASAIVACALAAGFVSLQSVEQPDRLLLAPMIGVMDRCILAPTTAPISDGARESMGCTGPTGSAASLIDSTLAEFGSPLSPDGRFQLGYTLHIPLLKLFTRAESNASAPAGPDGGWKIDKDVVRRTVRTLKDSPYPAIVYLFSTHFGVGSPLEDELASDPANLAATADGPMAKDHYYDINVYPWSIARTDNAITRRRTEAVQAVVHEICQLPTADRSKIRGVTLLGEVHHLFPDFEAGMGFAPPYRVSDYSAASVKNFRVFLRQRFGTIGRLNAALGINQASPYSGFDAVDPPSKDIRVQSLSRFTEHIDSFAQGALPIAGWVARAEDGGARWIRIYLDGDFVARVSAHLSRQDVLEALPELGTADVGWRWDLDFSKLPIGIHQIDVMVEMPGPQGATGAASLEHLATRKISIMGRNQQTPPRVAAGTLPPSQPADDVLKFSIDQPANATAYWYNPLVPLWHAFRNNQVVRYLDYFDRLVADSCLWDTPRYIHQILPFTNPGWDSNKFAVDASLQTIGGIQLGVSLYGEPTYGSSFFDRLATLGDDHYGVTEFHPLSAMAPGATLAMFREHQNHGARFVSFFLEPRWNGNLLPGEINLFGLDPSNPKFGSRQLYRAIQTLLQQ
ncbi:MAG: hypothetical protein ABI589_01230 [Burkholderiales bacterium]